MKKSYICSLAFECFNIALVDLYNYMSWFHWYVRMSNVPDREVILLRTYYIAHACYNAF